MSEIQEIEFIIAADGSVSMEVSGVTGQKCLDITKGIEKLLGNEVKERKFTPEFDEMEQRDEQSGTIKQGV